MLIGEHQTRGTIGKKSLEQGELKLVGQIVWIFASDRVAR